MICLYLNFLNLNKKKITIHVGLEENSTRIQEECTILYEFFLKNLVCNRAFIQMRVVISLKVDTPRITLTLSRG